MALQLRRGTFAELETITPALAEPIWTTDTHQLFVGDGVTPGGFLAGGGGGVTEIIAGDNISINTSTGAVTINAATGSTSTYTDLSVTNSLSIGSGDSISIIAEETGILTLQSQNGRFNFTSGSSEGVTVGINNELRVDQIVAYTTSTESGQYYSSEIRILAKLILDDGETPNYIQYPDDTIQTTAWNTSTAVYANQIIGGTPSGQTGVYARDALPAGNPGLTITISDSGTDANSPAGNYALAYWDADTSEWLYVANSNSVTVI